MTATDVFESRASERARTSAAAALLVGALVAAAFAGVFASDERFYFRDLSQNHGPLFEGARAILRAGELPWWNPWLGGGQPFAANPNVLLMHPFGLLALLIPHGAGLQLAILLASLLGPVFLTLLLRSHGRSFWGAATGGIVYGLSGYALSIGTLPNILAAASWVPPALYFLRLTRRNPVWAPAAALASACVLLPCEPVSALVLGLFAILPLEAEPPGARTVGRREGQRRGGAPAASWAVLAIVLGAGLAACQIVPALLWSRASARGAGLGSVEVMKWSLELRRLPELVLPGFLGDPSIFTGWWGRGLFETGFPLLLSLHVGAPALLLAAAGVWAAVRRARAHGSRREIARALAVPAAGLGFALLSTGVLLRPLLETLPGGSLFRYPEKLVFGAVLALAILAGYGVDRIAAAAMKRGARRAGESVLGILVKRRGDALAVLAAMGLAIALQGLNMLVRRESVVGWFRIDPASASSRWLAQVLEDVRLSIGYGATATGLFAIALILLPPLGRRARGGAVFASVALSMWAGALVLGPGPLPWRLRANPSGPREVFRSRPFFDRTLARASEEGGRVFRYDRPPEFAMRTPSGTLADGFSWDRRSLGRSSASEFGVEIAFDRSTDLLNPAGQAEALEYFRDRPARDQARFWDLAGVSLVISYGAIETPGLIKVDELAHQSRPGVVLYENSGALPRARIVPRARRVGSNREAFDRIVTRPEGERNEVLIVDPEARSAAGRAGWAGGRGASADPDPPVSVAVSATEDRQSAGAAALRAVARTAGEASGGVAVEAPSGTPAPGADAGGRSEADVPALEGQPRFEQGGAEETLSPRSLSVLARRPGQWRIHIDPSGRGAKERSKVGAIDWLVVSENDVPGWTARIDGRPVLIRRADGMQIALPIPGNGPHEIDLRYVAPGALAGAGLSAGTLLVLALVAAATLMPGRTPRPSRGEGGTDG